MISSSALLSSQSSLSSLSSLSGDVDEEMISSFGRGLRLQSMPFAPLGFLFEVAMLEMRCGKHAEKAFAMWLKSRITKR
jgi:hypothetical protein